MKKNTTPDTVATLRRPDWLVEERRLEPVSVLEDKLKKLAALRGWDTKPVQPAAPEHQAQPTKREALARIKELEALVAEMEVEIRTLRHHLAQFNYRHSAPGLDAALSLEMGGHV
jgi:hypothetical protein